MNICTQKLISLEQVIVIFTLSLLRFNDNVIFKCSCTCFCEVPFLFCGLIAHTVFYWFSRVLSEIFWAWLSLKCNDFFFVHATRLRAGQMQKFSYQPFGQITWIDSTKNRKDELFRLCSEFQSIVVQLYIVIIFSKASQFRCGKSKQVHWFGR